MRERFCLEKAACVAKTVDRLCRRCALHRLSTDPEMLERRRLGTERRLSIPGEREKLQETGRRLAADPEMQARSRAGHAKWLASPGQRERLRERLREAAKRDAATPEGRARRSELGKQNADAMFRPDVRERNQSTEVRRRAGRVNSSRRLGWCPLEYRRLYRHLVNDVGMPAAEARRMVEQQISIDLSRYRRTGELQAVRLSEVAA